MSVQVWSSRQILEQFKKTLPYGRAWPRDAGTVMDGILAAFMPTAERLIDDASTLVANSFPATASYSLEDWESTLGLPDPCAGESPTLSQRRAQVMARLTDSGGCSVNYFIEFAKSLGFEITITQFAPARFGQAKFGTPYYGRDWAFVWQVNCSSIPVTSAQYGGARFGDPYRTWGGQVLICEINSRCPEHTKVLFNWEGDGNTSFLGSFILDANTLV
ncbi:MAG: YmfQ family protein [Acetobacter sp.]|uniref:YmfQ family protein n=1 Tax=Acetobacter sp. TaxID=440 RepID=UPI003F92AD50